jgi:hypothetical protein
VNNLYLNCLKGIDMMLYSCNCYVYFHIEQISVIYFYLVISNMYSEGNVAGNYLF